MTRNLLDKGGTLAAVMAAFALAGCGGGGSSPARPNPTPAPRPNPNPTPTPTGPSDPGPINGSGDARYNRSNASVAARAISAYDAGATGKGVKIAIIDTGINPNLAEFRDKVDPASRDIAASRGVTDEEGHGTAVSAVAAAGAYGRDILGVAYDATIISLNTADPTDCDEEDGCNHKDDDIAEALDIARQNGARVVNMSLGGDVPTAALLAAARRATDAGIVLVISAGNDAEADADPFGLTTAQQSGNGLVIIAGAHDANRQLADFSNRAGAGAPYYLAALGERVRAPDQKGDTYLWNGTSFSAPVISGAAALLASAFPNLTGAQIVQLLLTTADDAGASGRDAEFGNGIVNIERAFSPQGRTTIAGSNVALSLTDNGTASAAMGDAQASGAGAIILDGYSRAYAMDLASSIYRAAQDRPLGQALAGDVRSAGSLAGGTYVSLTVDRKFAGRPWIGLAQGNLTYEDAREARAVAGVAVSRIDPKTAVAFGLSESGRALQQRLAGVGDGGFLVARDPAARTGFYSRNATSFGMRHALGGVGLAATAERGEVYISEIRRTLGAPHYSAMSITADRSFGPARLTLGMSRLDEAETVLGGRFSEAIGARGAATTFVDAGLRFDLGARVTLAANYRRGWTRIGTSGGLADDGRLGTDAFAFDVVRESAFVGGDRLALRFMQPLRVRSGGFDLSLPVSYNYEDGSVGFEARRFNLAPTGRELDFEAAYGLTLFGGALDANLFLRTEPGHVAAMRDDLGAALRFRMGF